MKKLNTKQKIGVTAIGFGAILLFVAGLLLK